MSTYVLIHGAGSDSWYWHRVKPQLEALGHDVVAVDLPCDDDSAGLSDYADVVVAAAGDRDDVIVVAQSLGAFTAPLVCGRLPVRLIVLVAATVARFGVEGLMLTVLMSGLMLTLLGVFRLGSLIRHIPHAVTVGFTCGIAVTIAASQMKDLGGLHLAGAEPGPLDLIGSVAARVPTGQ